ncbi:MAG: sugar-binding domain-containing protein [Polyangia bacterium]
MKRNQALSTVFLLSAMLVVAACSSSSGTANTGGAAGGQSVQPNAGNQTGGQQPSAGNQIGGQQPSAGSQIGGQQPSAGNQTGGQTVQPNGGTETGGQTVPPNGGTETGGQTAPLAGNATGGNTSAPAGKTAGGQTGASGGAVVGGSTGAGGKTTVGGQTTATGGAGATGGQTQPPTGGNTISTINTGGSPLPASEAEYSMDVGWMFIKQDQSGAQATAASETGWTSVSTPHTYNDVDSYRTLINHSGGDHGMYAGPAWYRKHFKVPATFAGNKFIVEFERIRETATFYINGTQVGTFSDGVSPVGIDITANVKADGTTDNVLAVAVDNSGGGEYWNANATNPDYGGLVGHVWLHVPGKIYQTYPLQQNLQTTGVYIYGTNYASITNNTAQGDTGNLTVNVESQVSNESGSAASATLNVKVVDAATGTTLTTFSGTAASLPTTGFTTLKASGPVTGAKLWSDLYPNLYNVVTTLTVGGNVVDARSTLTGFRQVQFKGGAGTGGVYINGRFVYMLGFAQRSTNSWAGLGQAVPDWMHDYHANLVRGANANYIRWMHVTTQIADLRSGDKYGIISIVPGADKEVTDPTDAQWTARMGVFQSTMIYVRNNPSAFFYEAGNGSVSDTQLAALAALRDSLDPNGGRGVGDRDTPDTGAETSADWYGTMVAYDPTNPPGASIFRGCSTGFRDKGPILEEEDFRDESLRGIWDQYSPPHVGGFIPGPLDTYNETSEVFTVGDGSSDSGQVARLNDWLKVETIRNTDSSKSFYAGYASIYFADENADGRLDSSCVCRVGGKVDAVRLPKEAYYAFRVAGNTQPDIHIVGHWTYPAGTKKTVYVLANNVSSVGLSINGGTETKSSTPQDGYTYSFPNIAWASGTIKAVGYDATGKQVCQHTLTTAGAAAAVKLTLTNAPGGFLANGEDVAMFDVEVVDATGLRVPTYGPTTKATDNTPVNEPKITFAVSGPGTWRGGVNESMINSTNNLYLYTEGGINRVFIRSQTTPGTITLTATSPGLTQGTATVTSVAVPVVNGLLPR